AGQFPRVSQTVATSPDWQQSPRRLVDILITGSRPITELTALDGSLLAGPPRAPWITALAGSFILVPPVHALKASRRFIALRCRNGKERAEHALYLVSCWDAQMAGSQNR